MMASMATADTDAEEMVEEAAPMFEGMAMNAVCPEEGLLELARTAEHIVILNDHENDPEEADLEVIFLLMRLRDIRKRYALSFNITVEMQAEHNQRLAGEGDHTDFLVTSSLSSMILAQLAESPKLIDFFRWILSNEGNELYLKKASLLKLEGSRSIQALRQLALRHGYILLGLLDAEYHSRFDLPLDESVTLTAEDHLIVLGIS